MPGVGCLADQHRVVTAATLRRLASIISKFCAMRPTVYLDYNATTPVDARVLDRMLPYFTQHYGNPASEGHTYGWTASAAVERARRQVAAALQIDRPSAITFTSGSTEGINAALKGVAEACRDHGDHIVTVQTEHSAVRKCCKHLEQNGFRVTYLSVDTSGLLDVDELECCLTGRTILVSTMWANNETGVIQPIREISRRVRMRKIPLMTDATQAIGKISVDAAEADILVLSGHKVYGPKGVGALYMRERVNRCPLIDGGGQERGHRGGTLNVPGIVGLGEALQIAQQECEEDHTRLKVLRDEFEQELLKRIPGLRINGRDAPRLPQTSNITFPPLDADRLRIGLRTVAISSGSACSSHTHAPSPVLEAMGISREEAARTFRISLGRQTTRDEVDYAAAAIVDAVDSVGVLA